MLLFLLLFTRLYHDVRIDHVAATQWTHIRVVACVERVTQVPWGQRSPVKYTLQLPPEYHPNRPYPVLIALHNGNERPADMIALWGPEAARNGYILAAPDWNNGLAGEYGFLDRWEENERELRTALALHRELGDLEAAGRILRLLSTTLWRLCRGAGALAVQWCADG